MSETKQGTASGLFREKSLEALDSPEALNDYLRVTSPQIWLVLGAVIALLIGAILWGVFGRIHTTAQFAVSVSAERKVCYVTYAQAEKVAARGVITIEGRDYPLRTDADAEWIILSEQTDSSVLLAGHLKEGDMVMAMPITTDLAPGVYTGEVVTEDLRPISLLLQ